MAGSPWKHFNPFYFDHGYFLRLAIVSGTLGLIFAITATIYLCYILPAWNHHVPPPLFSPQSVAKLDVEHLRALALAEAQRLQNERARSQADSKENVRFLGILYAALAVYFLMGTRTLIRAYRLKPVNP